MLDTLTIRKNLGVSQARWTEWIRAGLPSLKDGRRKVYDPADVARWLADRGELDAARNIYPGAVAVTRDEAAAALGVDTRTLAGWMKREGFPGQPGPPGKRAGWFPIADIEEWRGATMQSAADAADDDSPARRLMEAKSRMTELDLEERLGGLVDAEQVERFLLRVINTAKATLEPLADKVVAALPAKTAAAVKSTVRARVDAEVQQAFEIFADLLSGDEDEVAEE